jgi:hypothetical protein
MAAVTIDEARIGATGTRDPGVSTSQCRFARAKNPVHGPLAGVPSCGGGSGGNGCHLRRNQRYRDRWFHADHRGDERYLLIVELTSRIILVTVSRRPR